MNDKWGKDIEGNLKEQLINVSISIMSMSQCASSNIVFQINHPQPADAPRPCLPGDWTPAVRL